MTTDEMVKYLDKQIDTLVLRHNNFFGHIDGDASRQDGEKSEEGQKLLTIIAKLRAAEDLYKICDELIDIDDESSKEFNTKMEELVRAKWVYYRAGKGE